MYPVHAQVEISKTNRISQKKEQLARCLPDDWLVKFRLTNAASSMFQEIFAGRILCFDIEAAASCASIRAERKKLGQPIGFPDSQIAGIARSRNFALATRNIKDFENCGFDTITHWVQLEEM